MATINRLDSLRQVTVPAAELEKEGWLIKKGQKRYFVLSNAHLMWFDRPKGEAKGSLPVKEYTVQVKEGGTLKKELVLIPQNDKKGLRPYHLEGEKDQDVIEWAKTLKKVLNFEKEDEAEPTKLGWLEKKGQKRWFLIREGKLYWFNKEQFITPDIAKNANGSLDLAECTVTSGPEQKQKGNSTNFNLTVKNSKDIYILTAKTEQEQDEWVDALKDNIRWNKRAARERRKSALDNSNSLPEKRGWLTKKGQKRYFVLKDCILKWYIDSNEKNAERGSLPLLGCSVEINPDKLEVAIKDNKGVHYELYAQSFQEVDEWYFMLDLSAERAQTVLQGQSLSARDSMRQSRVSMEIKPDRTARASMRDKSQTTVFDPNSSKSQPQDPPPQQETNSPSQPHTDVDHPHAQPEASTPSEPEPQPMAAEQESTVTEVPSQSNEEPAVVSPPPQEDTKIEQPASNDNDDDSQDEIIYDEGEQPQQSHQRKNSTDSTDHSVSHDEVSKSAATSDLDSKVSQVELEHLEKELNKANHSRDALMQSNKSLEMQLEQHEAEIKKLHERIQQLKDQEHHTDTSQDALQSVQHRLEEALQEKEKVEHQVQQLRDSLQHEKQEKDEIASQLKLEQQQRQSLEVSLTKERDQHKQEIQSLIGIQSDQSSVEAKLQQALTKQADLENELRDKKSLTEKLERQAAELESRFEQEKTESSTRVEQMRQEKEDLKQKYHTLQSDSDTRIQSLQNNLSKFAQEKESLVAQVTSEKNQVATSELQRQRLEQDLKSEHDRLSIAEVQLRDHNEAAAVAKSRIAILEAEVTEKQKIEKELHDVKHHLENEIKEKQRFQSQLAEEKDQIDSLQKLLESEREAHKKEIQTILSSSNDQNNNIGKVLSEKAELERQLNEEQQKHQQLKKSKDTADNNAKLEQDHSRKIIEEQQLQIDQLNKSVKEISGKLSTTQSQLDAVETNLKAEIESKQHQEKQSNSNQQRVIDLESQLKVEQQKQKEIEKALHELQAVTKQKHQIEEELKVERSRSQTLQSQLSTKSTDDTSVLNMKEENEKLKKQLVVKEKSFRGRWRPDYEVTNCTKCKSDFGLFNRRHHCRHCGEIFCGDCSSQQAPLSSSNPQLVRVCDACFAEASPASHSKRLSAPM